MPLESFFSRLLFMPFSKNDEVGTESVASGHVESPMPTFVPGAMHPVPAKVLCVLPPGVPVLPDPQG